MASAHKKRHRLIAPLLGSSALMLSPTHAEDFSHQQWACQPDDNGQWHCQQQQSSGPYPQPQVLPPSVGKQLQKKASADTATADQDPAAVATKDPRNEWDWITKAQLPADKECKTGCDGTYLAPEADWPEADQDPDNAPLRADANSSAIEGDIVTLSGDVTLTQGNRRIKAEDAVLNKVKKELSLAGDIEMRQPNQLIRGSAAQLNTETNLGEIQNVRFVQHDQHIHGTAASAKRISEQVVELEQATYSQCVPDDEDWLVKTSHLTLDNESGIGTAKHARLHIGSVPVLYSPYLSFPIDDRRMTGFLWPTVGSGESGFDLTVPYYLNLAPNFDATIAPRHVADRGTMAEVEFRYLNSFSAWELEGSGLQDDDITGDDRWSSRLQQRGYFSDRWTSSIDYNKVSDDDFFDDFTLNSIDIRRTDHLNQQANIQYQSQHWSTTLRAIDYQTIDDDVEKPYQRVPQLIVQNRALATNFSPDLILTAEYTEFDHDDSVEDGGTFVTGQRVYAETGASFPMRWPAGFIVPTAKVRHVEYDIDEVLNAGDADSPATTVPLGTLDMGLFFERNTRFGGEGYTQTLEPRLFYFYSDFENQDDQPDYDTSRLTFDYAQLYRDTRFSGHDRLDDANQLSVGVTTRFLKNATGDEVFSFGIGQIIYFEDRRVEVPSTPLEIRDRDTESSSSIAAGLQYRPNDQFWLSSSLLYDEHSNQMDEGGVNVQYQTDGRALYNAGYRYRRGGASQFTSTTERDLEQTDVSAVFPLSEQWSMFAKFQYDLEEHRSLEDLFGLEYNSCCWIARIVYQRAVDDEFDKGNGDTGVNRSNTVLLEFQLKGMGSLGSKTENMLEESILGYEQ